MNGESSERRPAKVDNSEGGGDICAPPEVQQSQTTAANVNNQWRDMNQQHDSIFFLQCGVRGQRCLQRACGLGEVDEVVSWWVMVEAQSTGPLETDRRLGKPLAVRVSGSPVKVGTPPVRWNEQFTGKGLKGLREADCRDQGGPW